MSAYTDELSTLSFTHHLRLNETSGTTAAASISSEDWTYGAGVTLNQTGGADDGDAAISFDGSSAGNYVDNATPIDETDYDFTLRSSKVVWMTINLDVNNKDQILYQQGDGRGGFFIYVLGSSSNLYINYTNGEAANFSGNASAPSTGTWHSLCMVHDDGADTVTMYVDGSSSFTVDITSLTDENLTGTFVVIGDAQGTTTGSAQRVRLHDDTRWAVGDAEVDGLIGELAYKASGTITAAQVSDLHDAWAGTGGGIALGTYVKRYIKLLWAP